MEENVLFKDTMGIIVDVISSHKYESRPIPAGVLDPIPETRYLRVSVNADALYGSSMNDIIDSLIVELKKYKEELGE